MVTWGVTGRGSEKTATVFCTACREILEAEVKLEEAKFAASGFEMIHRCKPATTKAP